MAPISPVSSENKPAGGGVPASKLEEEEEDSDNEDIL